MNTNCKYLSRSIAVLAIAGLALVQPIVAQSPGYEAKAKKLGIEGDNEAVVSALRDLAVDQILEFQRNNMLGVGGSLNPVVDNRIVVRAVGATFVDGEQNPVPYMTGATSWEAPGDSGALKEPERREVKKNRVS